MIRKTRNRHSKICLFCRKRKKKCSRENPCRECLNANVKCEYTEESNITSNKSKIKKSPTIEDRMNNRIQNIYQKNNLSNRRLTNSTRNESMHNVPKLNIYKKYSSTNVRDFTQIKYGPFSWTSLMKSDPVLSSLEQYVLSNFFDLQEVKPKSFLEKNHNENLPQDLKNIIHPEEASDINKGFILNIEDCLSTEFCEELGNALPLFEITWNLINIFFKSVYPLLPIIDESNFKNEIERILVKGEDSDSTKWKINIDKKTDIANIGILLVLIRISFSFQYEVSPLKCFKDVVDEKIPQWLSEEEVIKSYKHILLAKKCIRYFNIGRKCSIEVLQLLMIYKFYHRYSPENSDGIDEYDSEVTLGSIVQLAMSIGVNREPTLIFSFKNNKEFCHLVRKLWYILILWDIHETCVVGGFFIIDSSQYDVEFPYFSIEVSNTLDTNLEKSSMDILKLIWLQFFPLKDILMSLIDIRVKFSVEDILVLLCEIESSQLFSPLNINSEIDKLNYSSNANLIRSIRIMIYFEIKSFIMCVSYLLFLHCEEAKSERMCNILIKKTLSVITCDLITGFYSIIFSNRVIDFFIIPSVESSIQKANIILLSLIIRANNLKQNDIAKNGYEENMKRLRFFNCLRACSSLCISLGSLLSSWYCYSLQIVKAHKYLYNLLFEMSFSSSDYIYQVNFSLAELCSLCENSIEQVGCMLPHVLYSNINLFKEHYLSDNDHSIENDVLRCSLINYYRVNPRIGLTQNVSSYYKYELSDNIIPKHWLDANNYPRPLQTSFFSNKTFGIREEFLDYLQNPSVNFDFNFDDIFYNFQNLE